MSIIFISILYRLIMTALVISVIVFLFRKMGKNRESNEVSDNNWYLHISLSREDILSQIFFILSLVFLFFTLLSINRDLWLGVDWYWAIGFVSVIGMYIAYRFRLPLVLISSLFGFIAWWVAKSITLTAEDGIKTMTVFVGLAFIFVIFYLLGKWSFGIVKYRRFYFVYMVLSFMYLAGSFFIFSTEKGLRFFESMTDGVYFIHSWQMIVILALFLSISIVLTIQTYRMRFASEYELVSLLGFMTFLILVLMLPQQDMFIGYSDLTVAGVFWLVFFNVFIFIILLSIIFLGYRQREIWMINFGAKSVFILIIIKYFDWFFEFMDKSLFFIIAGILMLALGRSMEKGRKYIITNVKNKL